MRLERLNQYAALRVAEDSSNDASLSREARLDNLRVLVGEAFFASWSPRSRQFPTTFSAATWRTWRFGLADSSQKTSSTEAPYSERERRASSRPGCVRDAWTSGDLFATHQRGHAKFGLLRDGSGNERELTQSSFSSFLQQRDGDVRRDAFHRFYGSFEITSSRWPRRWRVRSARMSSTPARGTTPRRSQRRSSRMTCPSPSTTIWSRRSAATFRLSTASFDLRKRVLGPQDIHHYDTYVPMVGDV